MSDNWLYLGFIHQADVGRWLDENQINLGNSDETAQHWLVADTATGDLYAASCRLAHAIVHQQQLPDQDAR
jgi:hypothetical protein